MIVYWGEKYAFDNANIGWVDEPQPLRKAYLGEVFKECKQLNSFPNLLTVGQCPAINDQTDNMFIVTCPYDFDLTWNNNNMITSTGHNEEFFKNVYFRRGPPEYGFGSLMVPRMYMFASESLMMETLPAFYHENDFTNNSTFIAGTYNIGKHLRGMETPFKFRRKGTIRFKRGDALYYMKLRTDKKIKLQHFNVTDELLSLSASIIGVRDHTQGTNPLSFFYDLAKSKNINAKYLEIINKNLI